jgi:hypothetical protein
MLATFMNTLFELYLLRVLLPRLNGLFGNTYGAEGEAT